jgi:hypothetical protein
VEAALAKQRKWKPSLQPKIPKEIIQEYPWDKSEIKGIY